MVPNELPTNTVLGVTAILITDYSSIFFDFLATGRPVVFYTPDAAAFAGTRGTYFGAEELPGPVHHTLDQVAASVYAYAAGTIPDDAAATAGADDHGVGVLRKQLAFPDCTHDGVVHTKVQGTRPDDASFRYPRVSSSSNSTPSPSAIRLTKLK